MKRLLMVALVVVALAAVMVVGIGGAAAAGPGWGRMAATTSMTGDYPLRTQDRLQIHQSAMTGTTTGPMAQGAMAWLPAGATVSSVTRDVQVDGNTRTVTVTFHLTLADGTTSDVQRVHVYTLQADGTWALTSAPDCPNR